MADLSDGSVKPNVLIDVLQAASEGGGFTLIVDEFRITLIKDEKPNVYDLPEVVGRKMIATLANNYGVQNHYFYHPETVIPTGSKKH